MHMNLVDELAKAVGSKTALAEEISHVAGERATIKMVSGWRRNGISWRFRGAFAQLATYYNVDLPKRFLIDDNGMGERAL